MSEDKELEIENKDEDKTVQTPIESDNGIAFVNNNQNGMGNIVSPQP